MTTEAQRTEPSAADHEPRALPRIDELRPAFGVSEPVPGLFHWTALQRFVEYQ